MKGWVLVAVSGMKEYLALIRRSGQGIKSEGFPWPESEMGHGCDGVQHNVWRKALSVPTRFSICTSSDHEVSYTISADRPGRFQRMVNHHALDEGRLQKIPGRNQALILPALIHGVGNIRHKSGLPAWIARETGIRQNA